MECRSTVAALLFLFCSVADAQYIGWLNGSSHAVSSPATVTFQGVLSSNANASNGYTPFRKQHTNCAESYSGGSLQPTGVPVGQLACTSADATAITAAGGPTLGYVAATATGTGIAGVTNGQGAGGTDSPTAITDTYGATTWDSVCTSDAVYASLGTIHDIPMPACQASASAEFIQTTTTGYGNADTLWPTNWISALDTSRYVMRSLFFYVEDVSTLWDFEFDTNYNSSAGYYYGWGTHWGKGAGMFQYCPQNCTGWKTLRFTPVAGGSSINTYALTTGHYYFMSWWLSRGDVATCTPSSGSNCYTYDYALIYDQTAGTTPTLYSLLDDTSGLAAGGIPIDHSTWTRNLETSQIQIDSVYANTTTGIRVISDVTTFYSK